MNKTIYIFDIDGCIMKEFFPNEFTKDGIAIHDIFDYILKGYDVRVHDEFTRYWQENVRNIDEVYFVTGRQRSLFGKLTYYQLQPFFLDGFNYKAPEIKFYPEDGKYDPKYYFNWKLNTISNLINKESKILVFDDNCGYFKDLENLNGYDITCHEVKEEDDWRRLRNG